MEVRQRGLVVEQVDVRRPAVHEEIDHPLGLWRVVGKQDTPVCSATGERSGRTKERRQRGGAEAGATAAEERAAGDVQGAL